MVNDPAAQPLKPVYGPVTFVAALGNILLVEFCVWVFLPWFVLAVYVVPLLLIDLVVAAVLKARPGVWGEVGRGMMIGLIAVPAALAFFLPGFLIVQALGIV